MSHKACIGCCACLAVLYSLIMALCFGLHWMNASRLYEIGEDKIDFNTIMDNEMNALDFPMYYHCGVEYSEVLDTFEVSWSAIEDMEIYPPEFYEGWEENGNTGTPRLEDWDVGKDWINAMGLCAIMFIVFTITGLLSVISAFVPMLRRPAFILNLLVEIFQIIALFILIDVRTNPYANICATIIWPSF